MSTSDTRATFGGRVGASVSYHFHNLRVLLGYASPWVLLVPALSMCLTVLCLRTPARWLVEKATQEIAGPSILAAALLVSLLFWARTKHCFARWLVLLSGSLFLRELHVWGINDGIYLLLLALLWHASRQIDRMKPFAESRAIVSLLLGALVTYFISKTFDRAWWRFLPGWRFWNDPVEETLESTGHVLILGMAMASEWLAARARGGIPPNTVVRHGSRWALVFLAVAGAALGWMHWYPAAPPPAQRAADSLPLELSSLCVVQPDLGENLFLASSDEERTLTLWSFAAQGEPVTVSALELNVPLDDDTFYHLDDLEDLASDGRGTYYAVASHRHIVPDEDSARMAKSSGTECALVSFQLARTDAGIVVSNPRTVTRQLLPKIRELGAFPSIHWDTSKAFRWRGMTKSWQIDIEGLACVDGKLLLGFKNPVEHGRATILSFDPVTEQLSVAARPDLGGDGILALDYDASRDRLLVISNHPLKNSYGDSRLWVGARATESGAQWLFPPAPTCVLERAAPGTRRKASGLTVHGEKLLVCFDSKSESPIRVFSLEKLIPGH